MKKYLLSAAVLAAFGGAAYAGGPVVVQPEPLVIAPAPAPALTFGEWQGGYLGANVNWGKNPVEGLVDDPKGASFAIRGGYDWQAGRTIYGLGAEYDIGKLKGDDEGVETKVGKAATVFGRVGYDGGLWMPYALAGYTWADAESEGASANIDGYTIGLGVERKFNPNWSGYAEISYSDFGDVEEFGDAQIDSQKIKLGVNYRF